MTAADVVQRVGTAQPDVLHSVAREGGAPVMLDRLAASVTATAADLAARLGVYRAVRSALENPSTSPVAMAAATPLDQVSLPENSA